MSTLEAIWDALPISDWLTDWLTDLLTGWPTDLLTNRLAGQLTDWLTDWLTQWMTDWMTDWLIDWLTNRPTDQPTNQPTNCLTVDELLSSSLRTFILIWLLDGCVGEWESTWPVVWTEDKWIDKQNAGIFWCLFADAFMHYNTIYKLWHINSHSLHAPHPTYTPICFQCLLILPLLTVSSCYVFYSCFWYMSSSCLFVVSGSVGWCNVTTMLENDLVKTNRFYNKLWMCLLYFDKLLSHLFSLSVMGCINWAY